MVKFYVLLHFDKDKKKIHGPIIGAKPVHKPILGGLTIHWSILGRLTTHRPIIDAPTYLNGLILYGFCTNDWPMYFFLSLSKCNKT
jgi:hypothetical protein